MSSELAAGDKRSVIHGPVTDDDDYAEQDERSRTLGGETVKLSMMRDCESLSLSHERIARKLCPSYVRSGKWTTKSRRPRLVLGQVGLRAVLGMGVRKWVRNVAFETHAILGVGAIRKKRGGTVRYVWREARNSKDKRQKEAKLEKIKGPLSEGGSRHRKEGIAWGGRGSGWGGGRRRH
jgi:hypothetical protein